MDKPSLADLRRKLDKCDDARFDAFCLDYYPGVYDKFSRGMRKDEKITLLLDHCRQETGRLDRLAKLLDLVPPPPAPISGPFEVPRDIPQFVGRGAQLAELCEILFDAKPHTVYCLTGMGGIGKTALAIHAAHILWGHFKLFKDGVLWAEPAGSDPLSILKRWARAYGYDFGGLSNLDDCAAAVRRVLADKEILVILDDVRSPEQVLPLLPGGSRCTVLLTTRNVELAASLDAFRYPLSALAPAESRDLMAQIVGQERLAAEEECAAEICRLLGHLPLAVKIAAQRLKSAEDWRLEDLTGWLRDEKSRLDELKISDREVRASFAVSWEALDESLRRSFALLAVFEGRSFGAPAFAAVAETDDKAVKHHLSALVARSLLAREGDTRYRQHPLLADFAVEQLGQDGAAYLRVVRYYLEYARFHPHEYAVLEEEWENLSAGMRVAYQRQAWQSVLDYAEALADAWFVRGHFTAARLGYRWACQAAEVLGDDRALAACLSGWGRMCIEQGDHAEAEKRLSMSLQICEGLADLRGQATNRYNLAQVAVELECYDNVEQLLTSSRRIREQMDDRQGVAETLELQGLAFFGQGNYDRAGELGRRALEMQNTAGDEHGSIPTLDLLAAVAIEQGALDLAEEYGLRALKLCEKLQDNRNQVEVLHSLSHIYRRQDRLEPALACAEESLRLARTMGNLGTEAEALFTLGLIYKRQEKYDLALEAGLQSLRLCEKLSYRLQMAYVLIFIGDVCEKQSRIDEARQSWRRALTVAELLQHPTAIEKAESRLDRSIGQA